MDAEVRKEPAASSWSWLAGDGNLRSVRDLLEAHDASMDDVAVHPIPPAAPELLADVGIAWVDQSGG